MAFLFERLLVYQKAVNFADLICTRTESFPRGYGFLADQLNRASLSIAATIAEGNGWFTKADRRNFFGIARGSVQECVRLLELARRRSSLGDEDPTAGYLTPPTPRLPDGVAVEKAYGNDESEVMKEKVGCRFRIRRSSAVSSSHPSRSANAT
jgi:four helix bundle protein